MNSEMKQVGTSTDLAKKNQRRRDGWRSRKGNWKSQKRKKQSMPLLVMPADSGRVLAKLRNEGDQATMIWLKHCAREGASDHSSH